MIMDEGFFFTIFGEPPRQGPGLNEYTALAYNPNTGLQEDARVLGIGCGSGMQMIMLGRLCPYAAITATDIHQPFLDDLRERTRKAGLGCRITAMRASMDDLPFEDETFDLVWAEGSAFIMGFREAFVSWRRLLKPGGFIALSDLFWFTRAIAGECMQFFAQVYPAFVHEEDGLRLVREAGYSVLDIFRLPEAAWWDPHYIPLARRPDVLKRQLAGDREAQDLLASFEREMEVFRTHSQEYGYSFYVARKGDVSQNC